MPLLRFFKERIVRFNSNSTSQNPTKKTIFLLAVSEFIMVVLGILFALYIDRWNDKKQNEEKFESALKIIQQELLIDFKKTDKVFNNYIYKDSLRNNVMDNKLTREDYENRISSKNLIIYNYVHLNLHTDGFKILSEFDKKIPVKYEEIFYKLKDFYRKKINIDDFNSNFKKIISENIDYMNKRKWYPEDRYNNTVSEAQINFYLNNPYYKSLIYNTMNSMRNTYRVSRKFRIDGIDIYKEIKELLSDSMKLPEQISCTLQDSLLEIYSGRYKLISGRDDSMFESELEIEIEDNNLVVLREDNNLFNLYPFKKSVFFSNSPYILKFKDNGELKIIGEERPSTNWKKQ